MATNPWAPLSGRIRRWYCLCTSQDLIRTSLPARRFTLKQTVEHVVSRLRLYLPISRSCFLWVSLRGNRIDPVMKTDTACFTPPVSGPPSAGLRLGGVAHLAHRTVS